MGRVLVTGMSGTGTSTALAELRRRGFPVVDVDSPAWSEWVPVASDPVEVILDRVENRTTNDYGRGPGERDRILPDLEAVEPLLRATCQEIDASRPLDEVVDALIAIEQDVS